MDFHTIWERRTAHFRVTLAWAYEDSPDVSWADEETLAKLESGELVNVAFRVAVYDANDAEIGADYLGNSVYADPLEFIDHRECGRQNRKLAAEGAAGRCGSYFKDMISEAVTQARREYNAPRAKLRAT